MNFSVSAAMGFISIFGIAIQDAILVVTYFQRLRDVEGLPIERGRARGRREALPPRAHDDARRDARPAARRRSRTASARRRRSRSPSSSSAARSSSRSSRASFSRRCSSWRTSGGRVFACARARTRTPLLRRSRARTSCRSRARRPGEEATVKASVLVVDDERVFRVMAEEALGAEGFDVRSVQNLARARDELERADARRGDPRPAPARRRRHRAARSRSATGTRHRSSSS